MGKPGQLMDPFKVLNYASRIEVDLRENILPFWMRHVVDQERGAFFGALTNELVVDPHVERGALLSCRILWTYAAAYQRYQDAAYLQMADRAFADLTAHFLDSQHGGLFWSVAANGVVLRDRKQVYGQAFAIYAFTEYHRATGLPGPLELAKAIFQLLESHAVDRQHGGYFEAFSREWQPIADMRLSPVDDNEPKSQNTHLHVMEAYTNLLRTWDDPALRRAQSKLVNMMLGHIVNSHTGHLGLFFAQDWTLRSDKISYGHDIEAAWLLTDAAEVLNEPALTAQIHRLAVQIAEVTLAEGLDADGAVFNQGAPKGITDTNKEWWPQAEAVIGFLNAFQLSADERYLQAALRTWDFIEARLIDRQHGEWLRGVTREGAPLTHELKVGFWKCPYHNGRTGLEAVTRLRTIAEKSNS
jgi:mannobiose 2-epimerase